MTQIINSLAEIAADAPEGKPDATPAKAPEWTVGEIRLSNGTMHWQDESTIRPTVGAALDINVVVGKIDGKLAAPIENPVSAIPPLWRWVCSSYLLTSCVPEYWPAMAPTAGSTNTSRESA